MKQNQNKLTKEEWDFFRLQDKTFFRKFGLFAKVNLKRRIGMTLAHLATGKICGAWGYKRNKADALNHYLKACQYDSELLYNRLNLKKELGLVP